MRCSAIQAAPTACTRQAALWSFVCRWKRNPRCCCLLVAPTRTGKETINSKYGTRVAVLAGDFLFAQSSWFLANLENIEVRRVDRAAAAVEVAMRLPSVCMCGIMLLGAVPTLRQGLQDANWVCNSNLWKQLR